MSKKDLNNLYMSLIIALGATICFFSAYNFSSVALGRIDERFVLLALITITLGHYLTVRVPRLTSQITVSDTFIFLTLLLYGGEAAILLAALEAFCASLRFSRKPITILFNSAVMACATFITVWAIRFQFGSVTDLPRSGYSAPLITALCVMAIVQYIANSGLVAIQAALKLNQPVWQTWRKYYLWTSITYFAGASAAGITAKLVYAVGFYSVIVTSPIIAIIFLTYESYRKNIEVSVAQVEQAERHAAELSQHLTERQRAEEERDRLLVREQEARAEAEAANRMKDEFLAMVTHELRTPLTPILGWVQMLRANELDAATAASALESIERAARDQERIVNDLLDASQIVRGKLHLETRQLNLAQIVQASLDVVRPAAEAKDILIACTYDSTLAVSGDGGRLRQVMWNLLSNAVKFTPSGGRVDVELKSDGPYATIRVSDTGMGISSDFLPRVFGPFFQAEASNNSGLGGLGLGLAIVRYLVEMHGGTVRAESPGAGCGATFAVRLPLYPSCYQTQYSNQVYSTKEDRSAHKNGIALSEPLMVREQRPA